MTAYEKVIVQLQRSPKTWLVTGVAGFIGSNLLEALLKLNQKVIGLDNLSTGHQANLDEVMSHVSNDQWKSFEFVNGDVRKYDDCVKSLKNVDYVLHQAALGSVPRSIEDPISTNSSNISGFLNILDASKNSCVKSFTYAASSSTYGDHSALPKKEEIIGRPISPYAVTKYVNELYAQVYAHVYGFKCIGLRYFNIFGKRQDPNGAYAAVIPKWTDSMIKSENLFINGDGETSRDFCFVENAVQMNLLSACAGDSAKDNIYNVAVGDRTTLNELYFTIKNSLSRNGVSYELSPIYRDFRAGDVRHSQADINKAKENLGYIPEYGVCEGIEIAMPWYIRMFK